MPSCSIPFGSTYQKGGYGIAHKPFVFQERFERCWTYYQGACLCPVGNSQRLRFPTGIPLQLLKNMSFGQRVHFVRPVLLPSDCKVDRLVSGYRHAFVILI